MGCSRARVEHVTWNEDIWETIPYISLKFIIAHFATSEWNKHQILKVVSISAKRFFEFFFSLFLVFR